MVATTRAMTINELITSKGYVASAQQIEQLAHDRYAADQHINASNTTYLRVLVVAMQAKLGVAKRKGKVDVPAHLSVLDEVNGTFYPAVLRGVTTQDVTDDGALEQAERSRRTLERNRRSNFARSSRSTIQSFIEAGGDIRTLDGMIVTKAQLQEFVNAHPLDEPGSAETTVNGLQRSATAIEGKLRVLAASNPLAARHVAEQIIELMGKVLSDFGISTPHTDSTVVAVGPVRRAARAVGARQ